MSKFLSKFIQNLNKSGLYCLQTIPTVTTMLKRSGYQRTLKFRPQVKSATNRKAAVTMSSREDNIEILPEPIKSAADKKIYKTIRLENGLTALLISDPNRPAVADSSSSEEETSSDSSEGDSEGSQSGHSEASDHHTNKRIDYDEEKLAACALSVGVGSYSDPAEIQGLAHFVEHMVFMGSEKYPKENDFDSFIKKKGGSDNASTDCEVTTFYFEITEKHLPHAMDMFSNFFVSPLMKKEAMQRERETIESEFAIARPSDTNRKDQFLCSLFPEGHPARTFTWGNLKSLKEDINDDEKLHQAAHEFRRRHYSANRMTVAVQARMDIPVLEQYVINTFGRIPTNKLSADDFSQHSFSPDSITPEFKSIYYVKPVGDTTEVHITWCLRSLISEYQSKPHQYVSYLLGHEGKGSLLSYLRKKVWALGIYTGNSESGFDYTSIYSLFSTQVVLTKEGLSHVDEVLEAIFSYLNMLRKIGPSERVYEEIKTIEETNFRFEEETQPADYVETLVENMHFYPPEHYITGDKLYYKYDPKGITDLLENMKADSANIMILSNKHAVPIQYDSKEPWFGTEYKRKVTPQNWLKRWMNVDPYPQFHLPCKNVYLTTDFSLISPAEPYLEVASQLGIGLETTTAKDIRKRMEGEEKINKILTHGELMAAVENFRLDQPNLLRKTDKLELWYKPDFKFRFPTALLYFYFITPLSLKSPRESCLLDLWTDVLNQGLKEETYPANMADLSHTIYVSDKGVTVKVNGYSQNIHLLVKLITDEMHKCTDDLTQDLFEAVREIRARIYHNVLIKPQKLAKDVRMNVLLEPYISPRDKATLINDISYEEMMEFTSRLFSTFHVKALVQGNIQWYDAITIAEDIVNNIDGVGISHDKMPKINVLQLPLGDSTLRVLSLNTLSTNSIVTNYYQGELSTTKDTACIEILMMLMEEPVFDMLRTKEQLGYSVFNMMRYTFGVLGYSVTVYTQADKFSVAHVDNRVEAFLKKFARDMRKLNERTLSVTKQSLIQLKHSTDYELEEEAERNFKEIVSQEYQFDRLFIEAEAIEETQIADIKKWVENHFASGNRSMFRKLSVQVMGHEVPPNTNTTGNNDIPDYNLHFLDDNDSSEGNETYAAADFIKDIPVFKRNLTVFDTDSIQVMKSMKC